MSNFKGNLDFGIKNIRKRPYRSFCLMLAALIGSYALFVGSVLKGSLNNGMTRMQERMGADLMIVPESSEVKVRNILLTGEPEFFYMDISVAQALLDIEGVECATSQFYFTSLSSDCCSTRVQLIAYDPDTDFVIEQFYKGGKQVERHMQIIKDNYIRNNVKILGKDGKFQSWG